MHSDFSLKVTSDFDDNDSNPSKSSDHDSGNLDEEPHSGDGIKAWIQQSRFVQYLKPGYNRCNLQRSVVI